MNSFLKPAIFNSTRRMVGNIEQTGEQHVAIIEIEGVQFRSWLPKSAEECEYINHVGSLIATMVIPSSLDEVL